MNKPLLRKFVSFLLLFSVLFGFIPSGMPLRAVGESSAEEISVAGLTLMSHTPYTVYLEPTADCDPSFTPVVVTMEFESANYCILSYAGGQAAMGRMNNRKYIDLVSTTDDRNQLLAFNGKCDTDCAGADFAVRVSSFSQGRDALPVFGNYEEGSGVVYELPEPVETEPPAVYHFGDVTVTEGETYTYRIVSDESCDQIFDPFTIEIELFSDSGAMLVTSRYKNVRSVAPLTYYRENSGWIEFSISGSSGGKFWGMLGPGTDGADFTIRVSGLENNLYNLFQITGTRRGEEPEPEPEPELVLGDYDPEFFYYYGTLSDEGKAIYTRIAEALYACEDTVQLPVSVQNAEAKRIYYMVRYDQPQIFWSDHCKSRGYTKDGLVTEISLYYNDLAGNLDREQERVEKAVQKVLDAVRGMDVPEAERYVHDYLITGATYVKDSPNNQNLYSTLITGETVCAGYTCAFQYIMQRLGVPCYFCRGPIVKDGEETDLHAWNVIRLRDGYYNVDVTWDDKYQETNREFSFISYEYYNVTDSYLSYEHRRDEYGDRLPACGSTEFSVENLYGHNWQTETAAAAGMTVVNSLADYYAVSYSEMKKNGIGESSYIFIVFNPSVEDQIKNLSWADYQKGFFDRLAKDMKTNLTLKDGMLYTFQMSSRGTCFCLKHEYNLTYK